MSKYTSSLFESIKEALNKNTSTESAFKDFLKMEVDKTYIVRLIPNVKNPERTLFHYYNHTWKSNLNNQVVSVLCPNTYGDKCPIDEYRSKVYNSKDQTEIDKIRPIKRNENWLVNVFVVKDPTNPENQGKIKILRYGKQLAKIIESAISGDDADEFGEKIFDLSDGGCNLKIKVEKNEGGYATYVGSKFMSSSKLEGADNVDDLYNSINELDAIFEHKSYDDIKKLFKVHFLGETEEAKVEESVEEDDDYTPPVSKPVEPSTTPTSSSTEEMSEEDRKMQEILKDL
jgi:hypothetical protein